VPAPRYPRRVARIYSEEQLKTLLRYVATRPRERAIIELFLDSGIRLSELTGLVVDDVDLTHGPVRVLGKGGKERYSYFSPMTALSLRDYLDNGRRQPREDDYLFLTSAGLRLDQRGIQSCLGRLGRAAGLATRLARTRCVTPTPRSVSETATTWNTCALPWVTPISRPPATPIWPLHRPTWPRPITASARSPTCTGNEEVLSLASIA
jgi:integrase